MILEWEEGTPEKCGWYALLLDGVPDAEYWNQGWEDRVDSFEPDLYAGPFKLHGEAADWAELHKEDR